MLNFTVKFAIDKKSVRSFDADGRLHVELTPISKSNVCPYMGKEIPDADELGLEPDKIYQLLRHPEELAKAASTFNGIQVLRQHIPVSSDDHQPYDVVGSTGTDAEFKEPYLLNSLSVWVKDDIDDIESGEKVELSSAYRYKADMTPGTYKGVPYDGIMRDICGNHVAIVHEGRAGKDVMVADSKNGFDSTKGAQDMSAKSVILTRKGAMLQGALAVFLKPRIAKDFKPDFGKLLGSVTAKNFSSKKGSIVAGIKEQTKGKLAKDANVDGLVTLLDALEDIDSPESGTKDALETDPNSGTPIMGKKLDDEDESMDAEVDPHEGLKSYLKGKGMGDDDIEGACNAVSDAALGTKEASEEGEDEEMDAEDNAEGEGEGGKEDASKMAKAKDKKGAKDEPPPFKGKPEVGGGMSKDAVNKAIQVATDKALADERQRTAQTREAERFVRPWVGDLAIAHDSAEAVLRTALTALGEDVKGVHPSAYKSILKRIPQPNAKRVAQDESLGMDAESTSDFAKRYPDAAAIKFA